MATKANIQLSPKQMHVLQAHLANLKRLSAQARSGQPVDFGEVPRIAAGVCRRVVRLTKKQQHMFDVAIARLQKVVSAGAIGRTAIRAFAIPAKVCRP
jgi:hypothetical protein